MHMQRQDWQRRPDDEERDEYRRHNGQQRCDRAAAARDLEERSTSETNELRQLGVRLLIPVDDVAGDLRVDQARIHRIYADAALDVFERGCPCQADHPVLGGDVRSDAGVAGQRADRGVVDDRAAALTFHLPQFVLHATPHAPQVDPDHAVPVFRGCCRRSERYGPMTPALLNAASSRPNSSTVLSTIAATWASS